MVYAWGARSLLLPTQIDGINHAVDVALHNDQAVALLEDGTVWQWTTSNPTPSAVPGLAGVEAIDLSGPVGTAFIDGIPWKWYLPFPHSLPPTPAPEPYDAPGDVATLSASQTHFVALTDFGEAWVSGSNYVGESGMGSISLHTDGWVQPKSLGQVRQAQATGQGGIAIKTDGSLWMWGSRQSFNVGSRAYRRATPAKGRTYDTSIEISTMAPTQGTPEGPVTVFFDVSSWAGEPSGVRVVRIEDLGNSCEASVQEGFCTLTPATTGHRTISASYFGDANFAPSYNVAEYNVQPAVGGSSAELGVFTGGLWFVDRNSDFTFDSMSEIVGWGSPDDVPVRGDWNGDGFRDLGVFSGGTWFLDRNGDFGFDPATEIFGWGAPGWTPVTGDWNGDGITDLGVVDPATSTWFLDLNGDFQFDPATEIRGWGSPGDTPVVGDWDGDGDDDIGVFSGGTWFIDFNGNCQFDPATDQRGWGAAGWTPVVGDWDGDGADELGAISPQSVWFRDVNGDFVYAPATETLGWGSPGDEPVVADWNGDGVDDVGVYSGGTWFIDANGNGQFDPAQEIHGWGVAGWTPVPGPWN